MAGHSKWANIKHRKGSQDAKRGKIFTKIIKEITIASRLNGGDVDSNPRLRKAVSNAKSSNMPADKIERAIKKGTGELEGVAYEEITYEGYGPGGMALMMDVITDNKNRSVAEIRHILSKFGGNLGESGSVSWMFDKKGQIILESNSGDADTVFEAALKAGADDFELDDEIYAISTDPTGLMEVRDSLENFGYKIRSAEIEMMPKTLQRLDKKEAEIAMKLMDSLEDNDDVSKLYSNLDKDLKSKLDKGEIFSFPFNYYSDFKLEDGIILKGEKDYFALIGRKTTCNWVGEHSEDLPEEIEEFEDNDLDFEMM